MLRLLAKWVMELELAIICNQGRLPVLALGHQPSLQTFHSQFVQPVRCAVIKGAEIVGVASQQLVQLETHATRGSSGLTPGGPEGRGKIFQKPRLESNMTKKINVNEMSPNIIITREVSSSN